MHYVDKEICLNSKRDAIVACDSPQAHFKLTPPFGYLEDEEAVTLGLLKEGEAGAPPPDMSPPPVVIESPVEPDDAQPPEEKTISAAPANKAVAATSNKTGGKK